MRGGHLNSADLRADLSGANARPKGEETAVRNPQGGVVWVSVCVGVVGFPEHGQRRELLVRDLASDAQFSALAAGLRSLIASCWAINTCQ